MTENWFEPPAERSPLADAARLGDTDAVERGLRVALIETPLPAQDVVTALRAARDRGERIVRRRQALTVVAAAAAVIGVTGAGVVLATSGTPPTTDRGPLPAATTSSAPPTASAPEPSSPAAVPSPAERTITTDGSYVVPSPSDRPTLAPPTTPTPFVVVKSPCPEASDVGPNDADPCILDFGTGYYEPRYWTKFGDLDVLSSAIGTDGMPRSVSQSADGGVLAVSGDGGWIELSTVAADGSAITKVVRLSDPRPPVDPTNPDASWAASVAVHPAGQYLAASWNDGAVMLWDVSDPAKPVRVQTVGPTSIYTPDLLWSPDGSTLATVGYDNNVRLYRLDGGKLRPGAVLPLGNDGLALAWSGDGRRLAAGSYDAASVYDTTDPDRPRLVSRVPVRSEGQLDLGLSPDGSRLYTTGRTAGAFDVRSSAGRRVLDLPSTLDGLAVDPTSGTVATLTRKGRLTLFVPDGDRLRQKRSGLLPFASGADDRGLVFTAAGTRLTVLMTGSAVVEVENR